MISTYWNGVKEKTPLCGCPINGCTQLVNQHKKNKEQIEEVDARLDKLFPNFMVCH
jgi:hypothetical protein